MPHTTELSKELKEWLEIRAKHLKLKANISADGGHIMLKSTVYDPEALDEPLKSEAIAYFKNRNL
ncbi:hypothetical protein JCM30760_15910 [Thiomicrorhabdus hydrogeniphila]